MPTRRPQQATHSMPAGERTACPELRWVQLADAHQPLAFREISREFRGIPGMFPGIDSKNPPAIPMNFQKFPEIFPDPGISWDSLAISGEFPGIPRNFLETPGIPGTFREIPREFREFLGDFWEFPGRFRESSGDSWEVPGAVQGIISRNLGEFPGIPGILGTFREFRESFRGIYGEFPGIPDSGTSRNFPGMFRESRELF